MSLLADSVVKLPASNFALSALLMLPAAEVVASLIEIAGVVPPEETIGAVPVTEVTPPAPAGP